MSKGWLYCLSNPSFKDDIIKIGMIKDSDKLPELRAKELYTTGVPFPFTIEFAKVVLDPIKKETTLHNILEMNCKRLNPKREFFKMTVKEARMYFDLIDGEYMEDLNDEKENENDKNDKNKSCRDISKCFSNGQQIRHKIGDNSWISIYNSDKKGLQFNETFYKSMSGFANDHHRENGTYKGNGISGWVECECEIDGEWISTTDLPIL